MIAAGQVGDFQHIDVLARLLDDLRNHRIVAKGDQGQARYLGIMRGGDGQRIDVVAARREHAGDPRQGTGFVLQQHGNDMAHQNISTGPDSSATASSREMMCSPVIICA